MTDQPQRCSEALCDLREVELAQLKYMLPRLIAGQDSAFSRQSGP